MGVFLIPNDKKRVAIDIDFTIAELGSHMIEMHNAANSTNYKLDDAVDWRWTSINMTDEQFNSVYIKTWIDRTHHIALLLDQKILREAENYYSIEFVSSREGNAAGEATVEALRKWLDHHKLSDVNLVLSEHGVPKSELEYDFFIDDSPSLAQHMSNYKEKILFLVDFPHNRDVKDTENILRVKNTDEALKKLIVMAKLGPKHK